MNSTTSDAVTLDSSHRTRPLAVIEPERSLFYLDLKSIWEHRDLLVFLVWRDVKIRYKQTAIGITWVVLQPVLTMILFSLVFGRFAKIPSEGLPYPIFFYAGLLPWNLFANSLSRSSDSVVGSANLISKIYFPRLVLPLAAVFSPLIDFAFAFIVLIGMMLWFDVTPGWGVLLLPLFIVLAVVTSLAVSLWLSAFNVRYRDVAYAVPFVTQLWMFASPVAYPTSIIPDQWRGLYSVNPMAGVIEGFRWALLGNNSPDFRVIGISAVTVAALLLPALIYFRHTERTFADIV